MLPFVPVSDLGFDQIEQVLAVNFLRTVNTTKAFLPLVPVPGQSAE